MASENLIHVKFEYEEALQSKKDILSSEIGLLRVAKAIKNHRALRSEELKIKLKLVRHLKELKADITKLQQVLPKLKIPQILDEKTNVREKIKSKSSKPQNIYYDDLESELQEIQRQLQDLDK